MFPQNCTVLNEVTRNNQRVISSWS
jgi:hypothetical protein